MSSKNVLSKTLTFADKQNENAIEWLKEFEKEDKFYKKVSSDYLPREKDTLRRIINSYNSIIIDKRIYDKNKY
mgnify:CR=1 FL=1